MVAALAALNACDDSRTTRPDCRMFLAEPEFALVSEPLSGGVPAASLRLRSLNAASASDGNSSNPGAAERLVYVSLPSGAYPTGTTALIRNTADGPSLAQSMVDGGFDLSDDLPLVAIEVGSAHACGLTSGRLTYCWGWNLLGQLGDDSAASRGDAGTRRRSTVIPALGEDLPQGAGKPGQHILSIERVTVPQQRKASVLAVDMDLGPTRIDEPYQPGSARKPVGHLGQNLGNRALGVIRDRLEKVGIRRGDL